MRSPFQKEFIQQPHATHSRILTFAFLFSIRNLLVLVYKIIPHKKGFILWPNHKTLITDRLTKIYQATMVIAPNIIRKQPAGISSAEKTIQTQGDGTKRYHNRHPVAWLQEKRLHLIAAWTTWSGGYARQKLRAGIVRQCLKRRAPPFRPFVGLNGLSAQTRILKALSLLPGGSSAA